MARIELSNIGGGGGTTLSLTTTGTSGAATLAGSVLNIPVYQGQLTLTTTGTSGAATLSGDILNIPQYSGGGTPAGSTGEIQYNNAGAFGASANLAWDNSNVRFNIGAPSAPTARLNVRGGGTTSSTVNLRLTNSGNTELFRVLDNGALSAGSNFSWDGSSNLSLNNTLTIGNSSVINGGTIAINTGLDGSQRAVIVKPASGNATSVIELRPSGTSNLLPGVWFRDSETGATGSNLILFGRGDATFPSTGVAYLAAIVSGTVNANGFHLGFLTSSTALGRFEAQRIFNSGNILMQNGGTYTDNGYKLDIISASSTHGARVRAPNTNSGTDALIVQNSTPATLYRVEANGKITYLATNTAAGATGPQTINRPSGTVNFGIGASALVVTNSLCTTSSIVFATVRTNDATAQIKNVVPALGSFTINLSAAATAETSVGFFIIN